MTHDEQCHSENLHLTFSQRVGATPLPDPIKPEHLSKPFRIALSEQFREEFAEAINYNHMAEPELPLYYYAQDASIGDSLSRYFIKVLNYFPDDVLPPEPESDRQFIADLLKNGEYHEIIDLCEWFLRNTHPMSDLYNGIVTVFANTPSAYKIGYSQNDTPFIYPVNQASAKAIAKALCRLNSNNQNDILSKIREAATQLNNQAYIASAKFGMDAVEIGGSQLAPNKNSFGQILSEIAKQKLLPNNEIRQILDKINAYANEHARHAREDTPGIERDEAIYFFGLCAVTADYLASKQQPN